MNIYPDCDMTRWESQCSSYIQNADNYYTKKEVDDLIESATTSGSCCITPEEVDDKISSYTYSKQEVDEKIPSLSGYATEQWVLDKNYITGVDLSNYATKSEIPSLSGYATEQWVLDKHYITGVDLSDYVTKEELPTDIASKQWVINQNYASYSLLMQYVTNLQNQIDALREEISGCCADTGTTLTRWVTMTGASDYTCSGTTKMSKEEEEQSVDGGNTWTPTGNYRPGNTVLEPDCIDCGYTPEPSNLKYKGDYNTSQSKYVECDGVPSITVWEVQNDVPSIIDNLTGATFYACCEYIANNILGAANNIERVEIKEGVISVGGGAFQTSSALTTVIIPNSVKTINGTAFGDCPNLSALTIGSGVTEIGEGAFSGDSSISNDLNLPNVTKINTAAFQGCSSLHSVNIGSGVTRIQGSAFRGCSGLTSIVVNADVPPSLGARAFEDSTCNIYVPSGSVETYKTTYPWNGYESRIMPLI